MISRGRGAPLVLIPGIAGRWEWMLPAIEALCARYRVLTFSLGDVAASAAPDMFERWSAHIDRVLEQAGVDRVPVVGVSFGGLIAAHFAATRPTRVTHLILASTPAPQWRVDEQTARLMRRPRLLFPVFAWRTARRVHREVRCALPSARAAMAFALNLTARAATCPLSPARMTGWVQAWTRTDFSPIWPRITAPTLIMTGEPALDRIVPVPSSLEYLELIPGSTHVTLERTGHLGFMTRPDTFAAIVTDFMEHDGPERRDVPPQEPSSACV